MKSILLMYKSKTGFTKKYVEWIKESITCHPVPLDQLNRVDIDHYDIIIYGAGMFAGRINGLKKFKKKIQNLVNKKIIVFATGSAPYVEEIASNIKKDNFTQDEINDFAFYYFQSGMNYEKMGLMSLLIMKTYHFILKHKKSKSKIEDGTTKAISKSHDHSSSEYIKPMIHYLKEIA